jgi:transposase
MHKLKIQDVRIMQMAVQNEIARSEESRYDHRLHGILLLCQDFSCYEVAEILGHSPRTIEYWARRFEKSGFAGLEERERPGRSTTLDEGMLHNIGKDLRKYPVKFGYSQNLWDGKLLSHHLSKHYDINIGARQCQRVFHKLGFCRRKPRGVIAQADPEARAAYKKTPKNSNKE